MSALLGRRLGPYEILSPLGSGGMGEVYRARDTRLGRDVAVKVLPPVVADAAAALSRFDREARAVAALNHPNILALHDIGSEDGIVYVVTELLEGETLRARLEHGALPAPTALDVTAQIARGLAAAHDRGIIHRDIKPANIFLLRDGRVKILDFGLALQQGAAGHSDQDVTRALTQVGTIIGTPAYMAPEQLNGEPATPRSDLFAFGVVAHEMISGAHPFMKDTPTETIAAILRDDPPSLGAAAAPLPRAAVAMFASCLQKLPAARPSSAHDLAFYLDTLSAVPEIGPRAQDASGHTALSSIPRRALAGFAGALLVAAAVTWGFSRLAVERGVSDVIGADLSRAEGLVHRAQDERLTRLTLTARLVASFPELKALFETDKATIRDFLMAYQTRNPDAPILIALAPDGQVLARTDDGANASAAPATSWIDALVTKNGAPSVIGVEGRLFHAAAAVSEAGGVVFGHVVAATAVDQAFAQSLRETTQDEVLLLSTGVLGSTLRASQAPWQSLQAWREQGGRADRAMDVTIGVQRFAAREVVLADNPALSAIVAKSREEAVAPFRYIRSGLAIVAGAWALIAIGSYLWMARRLDAAPHQPRQRL